MRKKLLKALIIGSLMSSLYVVPVWGQMSEYQQLKQEYTLICNIVTKTAEKTAQKMKPFTRHTKAQLNIRKEPNADSDIVRILNFNQKVKVQKWNKDWVILVNNNKKLGFVRKKYLSKKKQKSTTYRIPEYSGYKSFMDYQKITDESSSQWLLQQEYAYTGDYGIRMVDGRYCVAIGFAFDPKIGQYFDLVLENGTVVPCIIGDEKDPSDCVDDMYTADNGCYTEFVVDIDNLHTLAANRGDISFCNENWRSPVKKIKIYEKNVLED